MHQEVLVRTSFEAFHILTKEERKQLAKDALEAAKSQQLGMDDVAIYYGPFELSSSYFGERKQFTS